MQPIAAKINNTAPEIICTIMRLYCSVAPTSYTSIIAAKQTNGELCTTPEHMQCHARLRIFP